MNRSLSLQIVADKLPPGVNGVSAADGARITIIINSGQSEEQQAAAFLHECLHIWHDDHHSSRAAADIEQERHAELLRILQAW